MEFSLCGNVKKHLLLLSVFFTALSTGYSNDSYSRVTDIGESVSIKLNLTELGWESDDADYFVLAWNNVRHPIAKLQNAATDSECYNDISFLGAVRCTDFNMTFTAPKVVSITMRVVTKSMAADYIFYAFYSGAKHNTSLVQIRVHIRDTLNSTPGASCVTAISSIHTLTELPTVTNTKTAAPVRNQGLQSGIPSVSMILSIAIYFMVFKP